MTHQYRDRDVPDMSHRFFRPGEGRISAYLSGFLGVMSWLFGALHLPDRHWPAEHGSTTPVPRSLVAQIAFPLSRGGGALPR